MSVHSKEEIFGILSSIPDPEIPVVNIREMGMLRDVILTDKGYEVILTPTYTGCPAMGMIEEDIKARLKEMNVFPVTVKLIYDPAWTTDWMTPDARERLREYGISPPAGHSCHAHLPPEVRCPRCASVHTTLISEFGSTACKALYRCDSCREPFDYFKCI